MDICQGYAGKGCGVSSHPFEGRGKGLAFFGHLLEGNFRMICLGVCMFNSHPHKLAIFIQINQDVFSTKFDIGGSVSENNFTFTSDS